MMANLEICAGQRFKKADAPFIVWEVVTVSEGADGIPHARMTRVGETHTTKTVSVYALRDERLYRFAGEADAPATTDPRPDLRAGE